ncbi:hypothetical protein [Apibacter mensalis]|nr:hypothetical protein [Apibacter mensalis]
MGRHACSFTDGKNAHSVTMGEDAYSHTIGENSVSCALGYDSKVATRKGFVVIAEYEEDKKTIKKIHAAKVGEEILGVVIDADVLYGFDDDGIFTKF